MKKNSVITGILVIPAFYRKFRSNESLHSDFRFQIVNFISQYRIFIAGIALSIILFSCEKDITLDIPGAGEKIVVDGYVEMNGYPVVFLTKNVSYFGTMDSAMLADKLITGATVVVSNGVIQDSLHLTFNSDFFPPVYYTGSKIKGEAGKTYTLKVIAEGKTLTAVTTIPAPVPLHDVWFKTEPDQDSLGYAWGNFTDPPETGNYYRLFTKRLHKDSIFIPVFGSVYDDKMFNGQNLTFSMMRGEKALYSTVKDEEFGFFKSGDTIIVKSCTVDKASYDFWRSAEGEMYGGGNPFTNPSPIASNIEGDGGLGVWTGYGVFLDTAFAE